MVDVYKRQVSDRVFMYRPKHTGGFEVMGTEEVNTKFNIQTTEQVIDMLGPVSYTHLDVYKRQNGSRLQTGETDEPQESVCTVSYTHLLPMMV